MTAPTVTPDMERLQAVYQEFLRQKYPGEKPPAGEFKYFDPGDDIPDKGMSWLYPPESYFTTPRRKMGFKFLLGKVAGTHHPKPQRPGWYIHIGISWVFLAETVQAVSDMFKRLAERF